MTTANAAVKTSPPQNNPRCFKLHRPLLICPHQMFTKRKKNRCHVFSSSINASVNSTCAQPPPPGLLRGIYPPCQSRGWGICKFCTARGPGICQPPGHSRAFYTHAVSYQNITTQKVLLEKKGRLAHLSRTGINCRGL